MARKPGLRIDVRVDVLMDERYDALADIAGYNRHEALGRMFALWAWCLDKQEFVLHEAVIRRFLGPRGVEAILGDGVDSLALGERRDGGVYVRGTESLLWLGARRDAAAKGGEARSHGVRNESGCFVSPATNQPAKHHPTSSQSPTQAPPNLQPSDSDLLSDPDPEDLDQPRSGERGGTAPASPSPPLPVPGFGLVAQEPKSKRQGRAPKTYLPDAWTPRREESDLARTLRLDLANQTERFRNHFVAVSGRKANWDLTFRNWLHESAERESRRTGGRAHPNNNPTQVALDELARLEREEMLAKETHDRT